jgi:hypothetical protein
VIPIYVLVGLYVSLGKQHAIWLSSASCRYIMKVNTCMFDRNIFVIQFYSISSVINTWSILEISGE